MKFFQKEKKTNPTLLMNTLLTEKGVRHLRQKRSGLLKSGYFIFLLLAFSKCDRFDPAPRVCNKDSFKADFFIKEAVGDSLVATDKVLLYASVTFEAAGNYDTYHWTVGNNAHTSTEKKYSLLFTEALDHIP